MKESDLIAYVDEILQKLLDPNKNTIEIDKKFCKIKFYSKNYDYDEFIVSGVYFFFFPDNKKTINTISKFWFENKKNDKVYTEYDFAVDILFNLKNYFIKKDIDLYEKESFDVVQKFQSYKNVDMFILFTRDKFKEIIGHISAFLLQNKDYFETIFSIKINEEDDLSDFNTLKRLFFKPIKYENYFNNNQIIEQKIIEELENDNLIKEKQFNDFKLIIEKLTNDNLIKEQQFNDFKLIIERLTNDNLIKEQQFNDFKIGTEKIIKDNKKQIDQLKTNFTNINEKIDKIYLRDTIKYSIRYIYRVFKSHFSDKDFEYNIYEEIKELKDILSLPEFKEKFKFLYNFVDNIGFGDLYELNKVSHPSMETRNIEHIGKYLTNNTGDLQKAVEFIKSLPNIEAYINLEVDFYLNKRVLEEKIREKYKFDEIYDKIIS